MKKLILKNSITIQLLSSVTLITAANTASAVTLTPAQTPLILSESVAPNLILTLDNSGSMFYARVPDDPEAVPGSTDAQLATKNAEIRVTRRAKSAYYNPMYYNPAVTYTLPVKFKADGSRETDANQYTAPFTDAPNNGFSTAPSTTGKVDLSTDYKVSWAYNTTTGRGTSYGDSFQSSRLAENPASDFSFNSGAQALTLSNGNTSSEITVNGATFTVKRLTNTTCSANFTTPTHFNTPAATCTKDNNNYTVTVNQTKLGVPAYYYLFDNTLATCPTTISQQKTSDNCYKLVFVGSAEQVNFARWYSFYRSRNLATLSAANLAFIGLPSTVRLTWQDLKEGCSTFDGDSSSACNDNKLRKFSQIHRGNFFNWLPKIQFNSGGTFLHDAMQRAGNYIETNTPWAYEPNRIISKDNNQTTQNPEYSCRSNYHIMMTDGIWNNAANAPSDFIHDNVTSSTLPDGTIYNARSPFADATANTVADLAFHYWAKDARTGTTAAQANEIKPIIQVSNSNAATQYWDPRNDPATWQHLTTFTVSLGLNAALNNPNIPWTGDTFNGAGYAALSSGAQAWPAAASGSPNNAYDLWHAAINSRGEFFNADSPDEVVIAFRDIINRISNKTSSAGAPGVTASIVSEALSRDVYETKFASEDWSGKLTKFGIAQNGTRTEVWNSQTQARNLDYSTRNIKIYSASATTKLQDFTWDNLDPVTQQPFLNIDFDRSSTTTATDDKGSLRVNYLRGDQNEESSAPGKFRIRSSILGDIINSSPVIVGTPKYVSYLADQIDGGINTDGSSKYAAFKAANRADKLPNEQTATPRRPMVYVGGNDGMLHGFDANTGNEIFAFIPSAVIPNLHKLTGQRYTGGSHQYFVDGTPTVADVYYDDAWHTVLVGTLRAGGRSIFALDITDPDNISLLWEKSYTDADYTNLGYTFSQPVIARLHTGKWAVVTGNGYGNQDAGIPDKASLMVIDIKTGAMQKEMVITPVNPALPNGMSSPKLADNNSDGIADYAYAGDLQGSMWRFDLVSTSATPATPDPFRKDLIGTIQASTFKISYGGTPLYNAIDGRTTGATAQSITAPPSLVRHPTSLGYLVIFGTGKYFESTDANVDNTRAMTIYGIWDRETKGQNTTSRTSPTRTNLQAQEIIEQAADTFNNQAVDGLRILSNNPVQWYNVNGTINKQGWLLDLKVNGTTTNSGEMLINPMAARGKVLILNTLTPNSNPCKEGVDSWLYGLDPTTGGRTNFNVFDLNNDKVIDAQDSVLRSNTNTVVSSYKKDGSGGFTTNNGDIFTAPSEGSGMKYNAGPTSKGRQSWRIIPEEAQ